MADKPEIELDDEDRMAMEHVSFTEEEAIAFKEIYHTYDQNFGKGDGNCSVALMKSMVRSLGIQMSDKDSDVLEKMLHSADLEWSTKMGTEPDGETQFPEFLLLIYNMQKTNFAGMNQAADEAVKQQAEQEQRKKDMEAAKTESKQKRASQVYMDQANIQALLVKSEEHANNSEEEEEIDLSDLKEGNTGALRPYDKEKDGAYQAFYWNNHKKRLDDWAAKHRDSMAAAMIVVAGQSSKKA